MYIEYTLTCKINSRHKPIGPTYLNQKQDLLVLALNFLKYDIPWPSLLATKKKPCMETLEIYFSS